MDAVLKYVDRPHMSEVEVGEALADVLVVDYRAASAGLQPGLQSATKQ